MNVLIADNQGITQAGLMFLLQSVSEAESRTVADKAGLIEELKSCPNSVVIVDYTLFDINDVAELLVLGDRFPNVCWLLFSDDLSTEFIRLVVASSIRFGVVLKDSPLSEIRLAISTAIVGQRYICQRVT